MHDHEMLACCEEKFCSIENKLEQSSEKFELHGNRMTGLEHDVSHLTKSLDGVTKALWGVAATIGTAVVGFVVWAIQAILRP